jgi:enoyl reductase-like protein
MCILQGPVAAKWSMKKHDPAKELLGTINEALIEHLLERRYGADASKVPTVACLAPPPSQYQQSFLESSEQKPIPHTLIYYIYVLSIT